jgi:ATP-binding protein involved in chromosome partitioning
MVSRDEVLQALAAIKAPDGATPLPQSSALAGLTTKDGKVYVAILADPANTQAAEDVRGRVETTLRALPGVVSALVTLTADKPAGTSARAAAPAARPAAAGAASPLPGVRHVIAVASGKGGVGKSTTSANLALGLAAQGLKVGLLDADIYGPSMPRLFAIKGRPGIGAGQKMVPLEAYGLKIMSIGFLVDDDQAMIWRGPMVMSALSQMLKEVAWGELDALIVDMPPGTGDAQLTMAQTVPLSGAVIVSTPQDLSLIDARRGVAMFQKTNVPILGVVENMSYFLCPHCGGRSDIFAHGGARHEAEKLGVPFLGEVPLTLEIRETSDAGRPVTATAPDGPHAAIYKDIARKVWAQVEGGARRAPSIVIE